MLQTQYVLCKYRLIQFSRSVVSDLIFFHKDSDFFFNPIIHIFKIYVKAYMLMCMYFEVRVCMCFSISGYLSGESLPCLTVSIGYLAVNQVAILPDFMEIVCIYILYVSRRGTYYVCACRTLSFVSLIFFSLAHVMNLCCLIHRKT